jgi:hypothetical protein
MLQIVWPKRSWGYGDVVEINWTAITYFVIGLFALSGFFSGWWKVAITTVLLVGLVLLLQNPELAQSLVGTMNSIIAWVWDLFDQTSQPPQFDAGSTTTWIIVLILAITLAILISRLMLPGGVRSSGVAYTVRPLGSILGGVLGAVNGFLIINLIREYVDGRNLPPSSLQTEISAAGRGTTAMASSGVTFTAVDVPTITILDSFVPWIIVGLGLIVFLALLRSRLGIHSKKGYRRIDYKAPFGYRKVEF